MEQLHIYVGFSFDFAQAQHNDLELNGVKLFNSVENRVKILFYSICYI